MLSGKNPFAEEFEQALMYAILNEKPNPINHLPDEFWIIIQKCLEKEPEHRSQNVTSIIKDLKTISMTDTTTTEPSLKENQNHKKTKSKLFRYKHVSITLYLYWLSF